VRRVLILCTGNSCRSQMAEGILREDAPWIEVASAGTQPGTHVHPAAVAVMREIGIEIGTQTPKSVEKFLDAPFDDVITVCDHAKETCPVFSGRVTRRLHMGFDDPADATGSQEKIMGEFRRVRDQIRTAFREYVRALGPAAGTGTKRERETT
jgi:arsenate reductase